MVPARPAFKLTRRGFAGALALAGRLPGAAAGTGIPLFDGQSLTGWTLGDGAPVTHSWHVENGSIATRPGTRGRSDLFCSTPLRAFELRFEFRLSPGANTGVKYFVQHALRYMNPSTSLAGAYGAVGFEFQLADNTAPGIAQPDQHLGGLYGLLPPASALRYRVGDWAEGRLVCRPGLCEHWIQGERVLAFDLASPELQSRLRTAAADPQHSLVSATAALAAARRRSPAMPTAYIALQQHDSPAWFRALRYRAL